MTFVEHLGELRRRLIISFASFLAGTIVTYAFYAHVLQFFEHPLCAAQHQVVSRCADLYAQSPLEPFGLRLDVSAYGGLLLSSPVIFFQMWRFVTPGLKANEKRYAIPFVTATVSLFFLGSFVAWLTFPHALGFLHAAGGPGITDIFSPARYLTLILTLMAIFGLTFEFPVVLVALQLARVLSPAKLKHWRRGAIVAIVMVSAVITPSSDPFSMLALAIPLLMFYELSIGIGRLAKR